ncbi:MAG: MotA/TolQ/ExbB proton channel family protein [Kiritimatiellae bacterium]|nr:MotA/TolQ/ExbB proton channel family protein [Kiritimatiellia bacterium]
MSIAQAWGYGGFIMWVRLAISILMVALVIYFLCIFRAGAVAPRRLQADVRNYLVEGDEGAARRLCEDRPCAFSSVALAALDCIRATQGGEDLQLLRDIVESEGARQAESMQSQAQLLLDLSAIAPMLGLLGTTLGMLKAFGAVAQDVMVAAKPVILAQGVSQAIITTIFGLLVAIPCMAAYAYFRRRASKLVGQLELASAEIVTAIAARRRA